MTVVFLIGVSAMGKSDSHDGMSALSDAMAGLVVMVLVLLCPYATYKFVHWASDGGGHDDLHRTGVAGHGGRRRRRQDRGQPRHAGQHRRPRTAGARARSPARAATASPPASTPPAANLSKEGIDAAPPQPQDQPSGTARTRTPPATRAAPSSSAPASPPLITRPADAGAGGSEGGAPSAAQPAGASAPGSSLTPRGSRAAQRPAAPQPAPVRRRPAPRLRRAGSTPTSRRPGPDRPPPRGRAASVQPAPCPTTRTESCHDLQKSAALPLLPARSHRLEPPCLTTPGRSHHGHREVPAPQQARHPARPDRPATDRREPHRPAAARRDPHPWRGRRPRTHPAVGRHRPARLRPLTEAGPWPTGLRSSPGTCCAGCGAS